MLKSRLQELYQTNKKMFISIIALLEAILIISVATFSWIEGTENGSVNDSSSTVTAGAGLIFKTIDGNTLTNLELPVVNLEDCSSVDGRNFFFPTTESSGSSTNSFFFRAGTDADVNTKYISQDFNIEALAASKIFIDGSSYVKCDSNPAILNAIRISLNLNDGSAPIVFCPTVVTGYNHENSAVSSIDSDGFATINKALSYSFQDYSFNTGNPAFQIDGGETKRVTFTMWLEGTDPSCTLSNVSSDSIEVKLILSTTENPTRRITFVDYSPNGWVSNMVNGESTYIFAVDKSTIINNDPKTGERYLMTETEENTFVTNIPLTVKDIMFARFDPDDSSKSYNYWANTSGVSRGSKTTYYAIGRGKDVEGVDIGYWVDDSCTGVIDVYITDGNDSFGLSDMIKFTNNNSWTNVRAYFFNSVTNTTVGKAYPGNFMTYDYHDNGYNVDVYKIQVPPGATSVIFSGDGGNQTVDITLGSFGGYNLNNQKDGSKFKVDGWGSRNPFVTTPNVYFTSATYGSAITDTGCTHCKPTQAYNKDTNFGLVTEFAGQNDSGQNVYHIILPADAVLKFNGKAGGTWDVTPKGVNKTKYQKIGYYYVDSTSNGSWTVGSEWPKV